MNRVPGGTMGPAQGPAETSVATLLPSSSPVAERIVGEDGASQAGPQPGTGTDHRDWLEAFAREAGRGPAPRELVGRARRDAVAFHVQAAEQLGWTVEQSARQLQISPRTLQRWLADVPRAASLPPLGRPLARAPAAEQRGGILARLHTTGPGISIPRLQAQFAGSPIARAELRRLRADFRRDWRQANQRLLSVCRWLVPGRVWAMDFAEAPELIDGVDRYLLAVRDLGSGMQLLWRPVPDMTAETVIKELTLLFTIHGAPVVLKSDNGSAFRDDELLRMLRCWQVQLLYSPPRTPSYNGACEASIGSLKHRTENQAEAQGRPGSWTSADVEAARAQANTRPRDRRRGPSRTQLWSARPPLSAEERSGFQQAYRREVEPARLEKGFSADRILTHWEKAAVDRIALRRALVARHYLEFRRRRILPPIKRQKCDTSG